MWTVYRHTSPSGKHYFGITSQKPEKRWGKDGYKYDRCPVFYEAIKKYGWDNFEHVILYENLTEEQAKQLEIELIDEYKTTDRNFGYNMTFGGDGSKPTDEVKAKISQSLTGRELTEEHKINIGKGHKGIPLSAEAKQHISEGQKGEKSYWYGKQHTEEHNAKISESNKGKHAMSDEQKQQLSNRMIGNKNALGFKQKDEAKRKISASRQYTYNFKPRKTRPLLIGFKNN